MKGDKIYLRRCILKTLLEREPTGDEFFFWHRAQWIEFMGLHPDELILGGSHDEQFDKWLKEKTWGSGDISPIHGDDE